MPARVHYHHPEDRQYSLDFVNPDLERIGRRIVDYGPETSVKVEEYDLDRTVYVVYTASGASGAADDIEFEVFDRIDALGDVNGPIAIRYLDLFDTVLEENYRDEGERVQAYKDVEVEAIGGALDQTDWNGTAVEVAGRLASNLILKHPLPNANHRTAIGMVQVYLRQLASEFAMPDTARQGDGEEYDWTAWVNDYIEESKRLLTVRRKGGRFQYLAEWGCDVLERKHQVEIWLEEYELALSPSERWTQYAEEHEALWIDFVDEAVRRAGLEQLRSRRGLTKHEFKRALGAPD